MNRNDRKIVLLLFMLMFISYMVSAGQFIPKGGVALQGPCNNSINITIRGYEEGFLNNPSYLELETSILTINGKYAKSVNEPGTGHDLDFIAFIADAPCDSNLKGNQTLFSLSDPGDFGFTDVDFQPIQPYFDLALSNPSNGMITGDNTTNFTWTSDGGGLVTYDLIIDNNPGLGSPYITQTGIAGLTYTLNSSQQLSDIKYYWAVKQFLNGSYIQTSPTWDVTIQSGGPSISLINPADNSWNHNPVPISVTTLIPAECGYSFVSGTFDTKTLLSGTGTTHSGQITLPNEGPNTVYIQCNGSTGTGSEITRTYNLDSFAPDNSSASVIIEGGATYSNFTTLNFNWSGFTDAQPGSNISSYFYSYTNNEGTTSGTADISSPGQLQNAAQGPVTIYVWAEDNSGNIGLAASDTIIVDNQPPAIGTPTYDPVNLNKYTTGTFRVCSVITESSPFIGYPRFKYKIGTDSWTNLFNMSLVSSSWCYYIPEPSGGWIIRSGQNLNYFIEAQDIQGRYSNYSSTELIDDSSSPPVLNYIPPITIPQGNTSYFNISATDIDLDTLTYTSNISGITITKINNTLAQAKWTPDNTFVGTNPVRFTVSDGIFNDSQVVLITVSNINDPPVIPTIQSQYVHEYTLFNLSINASDPDGDLLTYTSNSSIFTPNSMTGVINYLPNYLDRGTFAINITVSDGNGGYDEDVFLITVGYCGDGTCKTEYEGFENCSLDCAADEESDSAAIIINPRNCINLSMTISAAKLVERATCEEKGAIIDDMEVCGNLTNTGLIIQKKINGTFYDISEVVTDENGRASYTPAQPGEYRIQFQGSGYEDKDEYFTSKICTKEEIEEQKQTETEIGSQPPQNPPALDEPTSLIPDNNPESSSFLYFILIPLLFIVLAVTALRYTYVFEKKKQDSNYVRFIDKKIALIKEKIAAIILFLKTNKRTKRWYNLAKKYYLKTREQLSLLSRMALGYKLKIISSINPKKSIKVPFFELEGIVHTKKNELILLSIMKYFRRKDQVTKLLDNIEHKITIIKGLGYSQDLSLIDIGTVCTNLGLRARYEKRMHSLLDIKLNLVNKTVCLADIIYTSPVDPSKFIRSTIIISAIDNTHVYVHNYTEEKKDQAIPYAIFMKALKNSGGNMLVIFGQK